MSRDIIIAFIVAAPGMATVIVGMLVLFFKIKSLHTGINGRMDELLNTTKKSSHAEGVIEGQNGRHMVDCPVRECPYSIKNKEKG